MLSEDQKAEYESMYTVFTLDKQRPQSVKYQNINQDIQSKAELTESIYKKIQARLPKATRAQRKQLLEMVNNLRPSMGAIKKRYIEKGEPAFIAAKIVTPENYSTLPDVRVTKKQQLVLLELCNGITKHHADFIENGYK